MTATIDRLERDGLLERRADKSDRRAILAVATEAGHDLFERATAALYEIDYGLKEVDMVTVRKMLDGLDRVSLALEQRLWPPD